MKEHAIPARLDDGDWYHGSPYVLDVLATGSTVTRSRVVAEAFSHKPTCVGLDESADAIRVCHNGTQPGYLYVVDEPVGKDDVRAHPHSAYQAGGLEWLATRPLRLRRIVELPEPGTADCSACERRPKE